MAYNPQNPNGQATMANSSPVVLASNQTSIPVTQSGTWDEVGINDSGNSITVDNGGTFAVQVDGAALTALQLIDDPIATLGTTTYTEASTKGMIIGAVRRDANTTLVDTTNEVAPLQVNATGELKVALIQALPTGSNTIGALTANQSVNVAQMNGVTVLMGNGVTGTGSQRVTIASDNTAFPISQITTSITPGTAAANLGKAEDAVHASGDTGVMALGVRTDTPAAIAGTTGDYTPFITDALTKLWTADNQTEDLAHSSGDRGSFVLAVRTDTAAASSGTTGDYEALHTDALGKLWTTGSYAEDTAHTAADALTAVATRRIDTAASSSGTSGDYSTLDSSAEGAVWATLTPTTTSGLSTMNATSSDGGTALTNSSQVIKASAGNLYGYYIYNPNATAAFVQFYNTASASVTVGTTNPLFMLAIPAGAAANLMFAYPVAFTNAGWSWAATATAGGNGAPTTALDAVCWYK